MICKDALGPSLGRAAHLVRASMDARMSRYEITPTQNHVLMYLRLHDKRASQCEVTAYLRVKPSTANGILDRMEEKGLLVRTVDGRDARRRLIRLTEKGEGLVEELRGQFILAESAILQGFDQAEQCQLKSFLQRIIKNLEVRAVC